MMRKNLFPYFPFLFLSIVLVFSVSCVKETADWKGTMRTEGGVTIVENPVEPLYKSASLTLTEELSIGGADADDDSEITQIQIYDVDSAGNVYILDLRAFIVKAFDSNGQFVRKIGRRGQGPGEYQIPNFLKVTRDQELVVHDPSANKFIYYSLGGELLREKSCEKINRNSFLWHIDDKGFVYASVISFEPPSSEFFRVRPDFESIDIISRTEEKYSLRKKELPQEEAYFYCSAYGKENVVWGNSREYALFIDDNSGKPIRRIFKKGAPQKISDKEKAAIREENKSYLSQGFKLLIPDNYPYFQGISVDSDMRVFVATYREAKDKRASFFDVFDQDGRYIANVPLPGKFWLVLWKNNKLFSVENDDKGYPVLKRYVVQWKF